MNFDIESKLKAIEPKERPIILKSEMVRAILEGRKSQTRRTTGLEHVPDWVREFGFTAFTPPGCISGRGYHPDHGPAEKFFKLKFGKVGDRLWVRETWSPDYCLKHEEDIQQYGCSCFQAVYKATSKFKDGERLWKPSIHMPRWASRITLEITDVRIERLQDISEEDAEVEGVSPYDPTAWFTRSEMGDDFDSFKYRSGFLSLWSDLYGLSAYKDNPWVWRISFKRIK